RLAGEINIFDMDLEGPRVDRDQFQYRFDMLYDLDYNIGQLTPFVVGGVGHNALDVHEETVWDAGHGVRYQFNDRFEWRTAVRKFWGMDEHYHDYGIDSALIFRFGGNTSSAPSTPVSQAPRAAAPTPAPAAADSDNDGVPDSRDDCPDT